MTPDTAENRLLPFAAAVALTVFVLTAGGCATTAGSDSTSPSTDAVGEVSPDRPVTVQERWISEADSAADLDSPAFWPGGDGDGSGNGWAIVTAKESHELHVLDARTGGLVRRVGGPGSDEGRFLRPNGVAVWQDLVLVVERDNARIQVLTLPDFRTLGVGGEGVLTYPYGIAIRERPDDELEIWVTDDYEVDTAEPDYTRRVHSFLLRREGDRVSIAHRSSFGDADGAGALEVVESIHVDPDRGHLLIADEAARILKVYRTDGRFLNRTAAGGLIQGDAEGIALYRCGLDGYWIVTDQTDEENRFHILDRSSYRYVGTFRAPGTANTDGIALAQDPVSPFPGGTLFLLENDRALSAVAWRDVADALGLRTCTAD